MKTIDKVEPITKKAFDGGNYVDPNVALTRYFHVIAAMIKVPTDTDKNLLFIVFATEILKEVRGLLQLDFWDFLLVDPAIPSRILPSADARETRCKTIEDHIARLSRKSANSDDVVAAMDFTCKVVESLSVEFSNGVMPAGKPVPDPKRLYCAALIPALDQLFTEVWLRRQDPLPAPAGRRPWLG